MIRPKTCFAALAVVRDAQTNTISAFNIFEGIGAGGFPLLLQQANFFALWQRDATDPAQTEATFTVGLDGQPALATHQITMNFEGGMYHRTIVGLNGFVVPTPGILRFRVAPEGGTQAEYSVEVIASPPGVQVAAQPHAPAH